MTKEELEYYAKQVFGEAIWQIRWNSTVELSEEDVLEIWGLTRKPNANTGDVSERK